MTINVEAEAVSREENNAALIAALEETSLSEVESSWELDVLNDGEHGRWIAILGAKAITELSHGDEQFAPSLTSGSHHAT